MLLDKQLLPGESTWLDSEIDELKNHASNGSFEWMDRSQLPAGRNLVKLVWAYKLKRSGKKKSRLCVQGCNIPSEGIFSCLVVWNTCRTAHVPPHAAISRSDLR